jgi:hypothetical protein
LFMYFVFMSFSLKPLAHSLSHNESWISIVSLKPFSMMFTLTTSLFVKLAK